MVTAAVMAATSAWPVVVESSPEERCLFAERACKLLLK